MVLEAFQQLFKINKTWHSRLDGGTAAEDGRSSSGSLERLRRVGFTFPRLAAAIFVRKGELSD